MRRPLWRRHAAIMGGPLFVQQLSVAASTAFLTFIGQEAALGLVRIPLLSFYLFTVFFLISLAGSRLSLSGGGSSICRKRF